MTSLINVGPININGLGGETFSGIVLAVCAVIDLFKNTKQSDTQKQLITTHSATISHTARLTRKRLKRGETIVLKGKWIISE